MTNIELQNKNESLLFEMKMAANIIDDIIVNYRVDEPPEKRLFILDCIAAKFRENQKEGVK